MEIYVHTKGDQELELVEVDPATRIQDAVVGEGEVWLEDEDKPLEGEQTLAEAGIAQRAHLHRSTCRRVEVRVRYGGEDKSRRFPPSATFGTVFRWATGNSGFDLTKTEQAKHTFGFCDTIIQPDRSSHIGSFEEECKLCLDLAPKERFEG